MGWGDAWGSALQRKAVGDGGEVTAQGVPSVLPTLLPTRSSEKSDDHAAKLALQHHSFCGKTPFVDVVRTLWCVRPCLRDMQATKHSHGCIPASAYVSNGPSLHLSGHLVL